MKIKRLIRFIFAISALLLLVYLAACSSAGDDFPSATGSEEDSGEPPPTPETGSKVSATRILPAQLAISGTAVTTPQPPANRTNSEAPNINNPIDLVLVVDATGSMAPELESLQVGLAEVASGLSTLPGTPTLRYGFVLYRDQDEGKSTQLFALTESWTQFAENLTAVTAVGGGNYPEDVNDGLYQAVAHMNWQPEATKLLILLGDAPPQQSTPGTPTLEEITAIAAERSIIIYSIGSDGLDERGMAIFQQIAERNSGRFYYLTDMPEYGPSAATAVYATTDLPSLLVHIVTETPADIR